MRVRESIGLREYVALAPESTPEDVWSSTPGHSSVDGDGQIFITVTALHFDYHSKYPLSVKSADREQHEQYLRALMRECEEELSEMRSLFKKMTRSREIPNADTSGEMSLEAGPSVRTMMDSATQADAESEYREVQQSLVSTALDYCRDHNRGQIKELVAEVEQRIKGELHLPGYIPIQARMDYLTEVVEYFEKWCKSHSCDPSEELKIAVRLLEKHYHRSTQLAKENAPPIGNVDQEDLIDKFEQECKSRGLKKRKTIPLEILHEIAVKIGIPKTPSLSEFKSKNPAYHEARQFASIKGYAKKRPSNP